MRMADWDNDPWAPITWAREHIGKIIKRFKKHQPVPVKYCGGVRTKKGHHESRKNTIPSMIDTKITRRKPSAKRKFYGINPKEKKLIKSVGVDEYVVRNEMLRTKWNSLIRVLESDGKVFVSRHAHYGGIRGNDILLIAKRDLRRIGYNVDIKLTGHDGYIILHSD